MGQDGDEPGVTEERGKIPVKGPFVTSFLTSFPRSLPLTPASLGVGLSLFTLPTRDSVTRGRLRRVGNRSERVTKERGTEGDRGESPGTPRDRDAERK